MNRTAKKKDAKQIFSNAVEYYMPHQWEGYLVDACGDDEALRGRVRELLDAHRQGDSFLDGAEKITAGEPVTERTGSLIGSYKLLQQIGEGGFGVVYMAEQMEPVRRKVALKIIKPGMDTKQVIARFEAERQALAMMDHPNIAKVLDAGATDSGRPFFVMELVKGVPVTEFCDSNKLSTRDRLELFVTVCRAVQHAHQKGVIHRDLKPSNVMVTLHDNKPMPVIIDFGVSKAISHQLTEKTLFTAYGQMVGTPAYMSPEQAQMSHMDIDTRSDVYSLGVLLYELLTGSTPLDAEQLRGTAYAEMQRLIREEEAPKPSTRVSTLGNLLAKIAKDRSTDPNRLGQFLRGDLDWIVMKALEKERSRRYDSANGLANDIHRFLNDEAVEACPPSLSYQMRKFVGRHRGLVTTASLVLAAVILGIIGTTAGMLRARHDAGVARDALAEADHARDLARTLADEKEHEAESALRAKQEADQLRDAAKAQAANLLSMRATAERERGDITLAALLNAEALRQDRGDPERELNHRSRLTADLRQCPRPTQLHFHDSTVLDARFSGDGNWIVTSCEDGTVRVLDALTGKTERTFEHQGAVSQAAFLLDDTRLLTHELVEDSSDPFKSAKIHLWDWRTGRSISVHESRRRGWGNASHRSTFTIDRDARSPEIRSAVDGHPIGPALQTDQPVSEAVTFSDASVLLKIQSTESTSEFVGRSPAQTKETIEIWHADTGNRLKLVDGTGPRAGSVSVGKVSSDGKRIAIGVHGLVEVYDTQSGDSVQRMNLRDEITRPSSFGVSFTQQRQGTPEAFSPDGRTLMCRQGSEIVLIDMESGEIQSRIRTGARRSVSPATHAKFSPDSKRILALNDQFHPQVWDIESGQTVSPPYELDSTVRSFDFSPDGRYVMAESTSGEIRIWDTQGGRLGRPAIPALRHSEPIRTVTFSRDGSHLLVAVGSKVVLWPVSWPEFDPVAIPYPEANDAAARRTNRAVISPDGRRLVTFWARDVDGFAKVFEANVWDTTTGKRLFDPLEFKVEDAPRFNMPPNIAFSGDGRFVLLASPFAPFGYSRDSFRGESESKHEVRIWNLETGKVVAFSADMGGPITQFGLSHDGSIAWKTLNPTVMSALNRRGISRNARLRRQTTQTWNARTGEPLGPPIELGWGLHQISRDGTRLVTVDNEDDVDLINVIDTRTGKPVCEPLQHEEGAISQLTFSEDDRYLMSASRSGEQISMRLWDVAKNCTLAHQQTIRFKSNAARIELDPAARKFAIYETPGRRGTGTRNPISVQRPELSRIVLVCEFESGSTTQLRHERGLTNVAFSPDGNFILTLCQDQVNRIWDSESGELVRVLESDDGMQDFAESRFSDDGRRVIAIKPNGNLKIWDVATGQPLTPQLKPQSRTEALAGRGTFAEMRHLGFANNAADRFVITANGQYVIYDLTGETRDVDELVGMTQLLSGRKINSLGNVVSMSPEKWREQWEASGADLYEHLLRAPRGESWHRLQVSSSTDNSTRLWHLDHLIAIDPNDGEALRQRGSVYASQGIDENAVRDFDAAQMLGVSVAWGRAESLVRLERWNEAAADFEASSNSGDSVRSYLAGVAHLVAGNAEDYERISRSMLSTIDNQFHPLFFNALQLALLVPRDEAFCKDLQGRLDEVIAEALQDSRFTPGNRFAAVDQLLAFRRGDDEVVLAMTAATNDDQANDLSANTLLLQAMAHKRLGHDEQARQLLRRATELISTPDQDASSQRVAPELRWVSIQINLLLHREATEMLGESSSGEPDRTEKNSAEVGRKS